MRAVLCRVEERLIRAVSGLDQPPIFSVIERLECGHELTIHPEGDPLRAKYRRCKQCEVAVPPQRVLPLGSGGGWWRNRPTSTTPERPIELLLNEALEESAREGNATLDSAIAYLHGEATLARSENDSEDFCISIKVLALLRDGWPGGPGVFNLACSYATGLPHAKYLHHRVARSTFLQQQFLRLIPDYDYSNEKAPEDDPTDGRKKYYGNRFDRSRDLDTSPGSRHDATTTRETNANNEAGSGRMGDWALADDYQSAPSLACAPRRSGIPDAYRRRSPKQISSNAQKLALTLLNQRKRDDAAYCGA